jgi:hypothetical protein
MKLLVCVLCTAFIVIMPCEGASLKVKVEKTPVACSR